MKRKLILLSIVALPIIAVAAAVQVCDPATGNCATVDSSGYMAIKSEARVGAASSEQCATNAGGGTTITLPAGTRAFELQNLGPNPVTCTLDGTAPVAGTTGRRIAALASGVSSVADYWAVDCAQGACTVKCIAATAAQVTGACLQLSIIK